MNEFSQTVAIVKGAVEEVEAGPETNKPSVLYGSKICFYYMSIFFNFAYYLILYCIILLFTFVSAFHIDVLNQSNNHNINTNKQKYNESNHFVVNDHFPFSIKFQFA